MLGIIVFTFMVYLWYLVYAYREVSKNKKRPDFKNLGETEISNAELTNESANEYFGENELCIVKCTNLKKFGDETEKEPDINKCTTFEELSKFGDEHCLEKASDEEFNKKLIEYVDKLPVTNVLLGNLAVLCLNAPEYLRPQWENYLKALILNNKFNITLQ